MTIPKKDTTPADIAYSRLVTNINMSADWVRNALFTLLGCVPCNSARMAATTVDIDRLIFDFNKDDKLLGARLYVEHAAPTFRRRMQPTDACIHLIKHILNQETSTQLFVNFPVGYQPINIKKWKDVPLTSPASIDVVATSDDACYVALRNNASIAPDRVLNVTLPHTDTLIPSILQDLAADEKIEPFNGVEDKKAVPTPKPIPRCGRVTVPSNFIIAFSALLRGMRFFYDMNYTTREHILDNLNKNHAIDVSVNGIENRVTGISEAVGGTTTEYDFLDVLHMLLSEIVYDYDAYNLRFHFNRPVRKYAGRWKGVTWVDGDMAISDIVSESKPSTIVGMTIHKSTNDVAAHQICPINMPIDIDSEQLKGILSSLVMTESRRRLAEITGSMRYSDVVDSVDLSFTPLMPKAIDAPLIDAAIIDAKNSDADVSAPVPDVPCAIYGDVMRASDEETRIIFVDSLRALERPSLEDHPRYSEMRIPKRYSLVLHNDNSIMVIEPLDHTKIDMDSLTLGELKKYSVAVHRHGEPVLMPAHAVSARDLYAVDNRFFKLYYVGA